MNNLTEQNRFLEKLTAEDRLIWAFEHFNPERIALSSSFGTFSSALLHLASTVKPNIQVLFLDTGFHFSETIEFRNKLQNQLNLNIRIIEPSTAKNELFDLLGDSPWETDSAQCCDINKVKPMDSVLNEFDLWISGVRRSQTENRNNLTILHRNKRDQLKFHPVLDWSSKQLFDYIQKHKLPVHPLFEKGYTSIGCTHCTVKPGDLNDERSGRWNAQKNECGLHL